MGEAADSSLPAGGEDLSGKALGCAGGGHRVHPGRRAGHHLRAGSSGDGDRFLAAAGRWSGPFCRMPAASAALQRTVRTLQGAVIEPRELSLEGLEGTVEEKLAAAALLVLLGEKN